MICLCFQVVRSWSLGFETGYLSSNYDIIIVYVDARGTMGRGERYDDNTPISWSFIIIILLFIIVLYLFDRYKHGVYRHLGRYEALDTITVAKYVIIVDTIMCMVINCSTNMLMVDFPSNRHMQKLPFVDPDKIGIWGWVCSNISTYTWRIFAGVSIIIFTQEEE